MSRWIALCIAAGLLAFGCKSSCAGQPRSGEEPGRKEGGQAGTGEERVAEEVEAFLLEKWLAPQRDGDVGAYASVLHPGFEGTVLKSTGEKATMSRSEWIKRKSKALKARPSIDLKEMQVVARGEDIVVTFEQSWETEQYCDVGLKEIALVRAGEGFLVSREAMKSVVECTWAAPSTFYTFTRKYKKAWKSDDFDYLTEHTCLPFSYDILYVRGGTRNTEETKLERLGDLVDDPEIRDLLRKAAITLNPTNLRFGPKSCVYEVTAETSGEVGIVDIETTSCAFEESFRLEFSFEEERWRLCSITREVHHP